MVNEVNVGVLIPNEEGYEASFQQRRRLIKSVENEISKESPIKINFMISGVKDENDHLVKVKQLNERKIDLIIGGCFSSHAEKTIEWINTNGKDVLLLSPTSDRYDLAKKDYLFRLLPSELYEAKVLAAAVKKSQKTSIRIIVREEPSEYGEKMANELKRLLEPSISVDDIHYYVATADDSSWDGDHVDVQKINDILHSINSWASSDKKSKAVIFVSYPLQNNEIIQFLKPLKTLFSSQPGDGHVGAAPAPLNLYKNASEISWFSTELSSGTNGTSSYIQGLYPSLVRKIQLLNPKSVTPPLVRPLPLNILSFDSMSYRDTWIKSTYYDLCYADAAWLMAYCINYIIHPFTFETRAKEIRNIIRRIASQYLGYTGWLTLDVNGDRRFKSYEIWGYENVTGSYYVKKGEWDIISETIE